jgi:16S rRNA (uracil1498-N3)-methyltransferase
MIPRLHLDAPLLEGAILPLDETQAHYLRHVLRRKAGAALKVFNARDGEFAATIEVADKKGVIVRVEKRLSPPAADPDLWLLFAPVKRDAVDLLVEKATELGVSEIHPVVTDRTQPSRVNVERLAAIAREAAEQCGRLSLPRVTEPQALEVALGAWPKERRLIYCDEAGDDPKAEWGGDTGRAAPLLDILATTPRGPLAVLIGPEGGFAPDERVRLRNLDFVSPASLGSRILKAETAAIAALALIDAASAHRR